MHLFRFVSAYAGRSGRQGGEEKRVRAEGDGRARKEKKRDGGTKRRNHATMRARMLQNRLCASVTVQPAPTRNDNCRYPHSRCHRVRPGLSTPAALLLLLPQPPLSASVVHAIGIARATPFREPPVIRARGRAPREVSLRTPSVLLNERRNVPSEIQTRFPVSGVLLPRVIIGFVSLSSF